ncbi:hypothetical protein [Variovorax gossypii]
MAPVGILGSARFDKPLVVVPHLESGPVDVSRETVDRSQECLPSLRLRDLVDHVDVVNHPLGEYLDSGDVTLGLRRHREKPPFQALEETLAIERVPLLPEALFQHPLRQLHLVGDLRHDSGIPLNIRRAGSE